MHLLSSCVSKALGTESKGYNSCPQGAPVIGDPRADGGLRSLFQRAVLGAVILQEEVTLQGEFYKS
jgi:hypothetical protein